MRMDLQAPFPRRIRSWAILLGAGLLLFSPIHAAEPVPEATVIAIKGTVMVARAGATTWDPASTNAIFGRIFAGDQLRTAERSRAILQRPDGSIFHLSEMTDIQLGAPARSGSIEYLAEVLKLHAQRVIGACTVRKTEDTAVACRRKLAA